MRFGRLRIAFPAREHAAYRPPSEINEDAMIELGLDTFVTYNPLAVAPTTPLDDALNWMDEYHFRHLPVVDATRKLVGIVSELDLRKAQRTDQGTVADIMTSSPISISHLRGPGEALRIMLERRFHSLPVVEEGRLIGIVTSSDYLREFAYGGAGADEPVSHHFDNEAYIESTATIDDARRTFEEFDVDALAVLKGECPVGAITRRAVTAWNCYAKSDEPSHVRVMQLAATNVPVIRPTETMQEAAKQMLDRGVQAALVADRANRFQGLLTDHVILSLMTQRFPAE
jgi:CBS domain-containing protein